MSRKEEALRLLRSQKDQEYHYLGEGFSGIVFHNGEHVYKVHIPIVTDSYGQSDGLSFLGEKLHAFRDSIHFYPLDLLKIDETRILRYPYEESEGVDSISEEEYISFLSECWKKNIIFKSVTKTKNFIRANGQLKFIDYEILPYSDNLFLNMAARAFMYVKHPDLSEQEYNRLKRTIINNFSLDELAGFDQFLIRVFSHVAFNTSNDSEVQATSEYQILQGSLLWDAINEGRRIGRISTNLLFNDHVPHLHHSTESCPLAPPIKPVTLLIKACPQDSATIYQQVVHIVKQLMGPDAFTERIIAIDTKEKDFLREFTKEGSYHQLMAEVKRLIQDGIVNAFIEMPQDQVANINQRWFNVCTIETHTFTNIPVAPQLFAFEQAKGDYILQMDCDVLIGRSDFSHSYLTDMITALDENDKAVSVGFNIPKEKDVTFVEYHAPQGGYKPEVRFALLHKERLLQSRPWSNELVDGKLKFSWYQSLHKHQKETGIASLRGGNPRTYYIHPQNYRKTCPYTISLIKDRIGKNILPDLQREGFDVEGSLYDWAIPKRRERLIVLMILEDTKDLSRFFRLLKSIENQEYIDYGILIINNVPDVITDQILWDYLRDMNNVTYLHNEIPKRNSHNIYLGLHYFCDNPDSFVILANSNDYFLGHRVFSEIIERLNIYQADVLIGKQIETLSIEDHGLFHINFLDPRKKDSNVHHNVKVFKKHLFDSLSLYDLKRKKESIEIQNNFEKLSKRFEWINDVENVALFALIIEISENPIRFDHINYVIDSRKIDRNQIRATLNAIKDKPKKDASQIIEDNRIDFMPNLRKIELDITYACDLRCVACNRSCSQAPSNDDAMTFDQVCQFIEESIQLGIEWELINILGGEPTLHPEFLDIVKLILHEYIEKASPSTVLQITSNGFSKNAKDLLRNLPESKNIVMDHYSQKDSKENTYFTSFNNAPIDNEEYQDLEFKKGCWVTSYCGIGLNKYGYYPCGVAGSMDRVMGFDVGMKRLEDVSIPQMNDLLDQFCRYCGNIIDYHANMGNFIPRCEKAPFSKEIVTSSWEKIYEKYRSKKPELSEIYKN